MTEPTTHTLDVPGATIHYDVRHAHGQNGGPPLLLIGSPMDAAGFATLAGHFPDRTVVTYDPRGADAQQAHRRRRADHARRARRRPAPADRGARRRPGGPLRQQRRRRQRARAGRAASGARAHARGARAAGRAGAARPRGRRWPPPRTSARPTSATGFGPAMAKFIALVSLQGPDPGRLRRPARPDPAEFGLPTEDDGSRDDALRGPEHRHLHALRARLRRAARGVDPHRRRRRSRVRGRAGPPRRRSPSPSGSGPSPSSSRATTAASSAASTASTGEPDAFAAKLREVLGE